MGLTLVLGRVLFVSAIATGRVPFISAFGVLLVGVRLGFVRTTIVTVGLRRKERTKRANRGIKGDR